MSIVELFSSEGNSSCKGGEVVEMSCSTRWRHPMGLPRAEPTQSRAQVLWPRPQWGNLLGQEWLRLQLGVQSTFNISFLLQWWFSSSSSTQLQRLWWCNSSCSYSSVFVYLLWESWFWLLKALSLLSVACFFNAWPILKPWKVSLTHKPETLLYCILSLSESVTLYEAWVFEWLSVALKHPEHQHQDPVETDFLTCFMGNKQVQNKSRFLWVIHLRGQGAGSTRATAGPLKNLQQPL